jgi:hypothetical protein
MSNEKRNMDMILAELNTTFNLNIKKDVNKRSSAGSYNNNTVFISSIEVLKSKCGVQSNRENKYGQKLYPNTISFASDDLESITIAHEFGHAIEDNYRNDEMFISCRNICDDLAPKYISLYSGKDSPLSIYSEAFAETFCLYIINPSKLHQINTELFSAINELYASFL